jgi:hypothetical protein
MGVDPGNRGRDVGNHQRQRRRQRPQTRRQPWRPGPQLLSRRPRSSQKRSPTTGEKRRATSATSSTCSAAMMRRQWPSPRPRTGHLPSCRTASRARPCLFHPCFPTPVKQTGASLGTPGSGHQLVDPSLIAIELYNKFGRRASDGICRLLLTVHQCGNKALHATGPTRRASAARCRRRRSLTRRRSSRKSRKVQITQSARRQHMASWNNVPRPLASCLRPQTNCAEQNG